jgi:multidrug efflux pump subunit AcrA (membrane-fusion protein)
VNFQRPNDPNMVRLPATALVSSNRGAEVAILGVDGRAALKPVQIGRDFGGSVEVVAGLAPSDRVIDSPPETLQTGDQVQLAAPTPSAAKPAVKSSSPTAG